MESGSAPRSRRRERNAVLPDWEERWSADLPEVFEKGRRKGKREWYREAMRSVVSIWTESGLVERKVGAWGMEGACEGEERVEARRWRMVSFALSWPSHQLP